MTNQEIPGDASPLACDLNQIIHSPKRLMTMATLNTLAEAEFSYLSQRLELADSDVSKQMATLKKAGLIVVRKTGGGRSGKTWYCLSPTGKKAFAEYRTTLRQIVDLEN